MSACEHCGTELEPFDHRGNEGWICPNDCAFWNAVKQLHNEENAKSKQQIAAEAEDMFNGHSYPTTVKQTHCWTFKADGTHCPGVVERTLDVQDGPYGHSCPVCRHSLRYHPYYGQGCPGDLALKGQISR